MLEEDYDCESRRDVLDELKVVYIDKTHEDCGFKNNPVRLRLSKVIDLFTKLNLDPYVEDDEDDEDDY